MSRLCALLLLSLSFVQSTSALQFPEGMSFVGLSQDGWLAYLVDDRSGQPKPIATSSEPRSPTWSMADNGMAYLDAGGQLVVKKNGTESEIVLAKPDKERAFAQPVFSPDGQTLYVVELKKGISVNTDILAIRIDSPELKPVVQQRSAQFDPYKTIDGYLYYANVTCVLGCGKIIQELWRKQLVQDDAEQLTLSNCISRSPVKAVNSDSVYYSSNCGGNYHIWAYDLSDKTTRQLTSGLVTDTNPVIDDHGNLYFIRHVGSRSAIVQRLENGVEKELTLPDGITRVRDLRINL